MAAAAQLHSHTGKWSTGCKGRESETVRRLCLWGGRWNAKQVDKLRNRFISIHVNPSLRPWEGLSSFPPPLPQSLIHSLCQFWSIFFTVPPPQDEVPESDIRSKQIQMWHRALLLTPWLFLCVVLCCVVLSNNLLILCCRWDPSVLYVLYLTGFVHLLFGSFLTHTWWKTGLFELFFRFKHVTDMSVLD